VQSRPRLARICSLRKINCTLQNALAENQLKNLRGGLRGGMRGTLCIPTPLLLYRSTPSNSAFRSLRKVNCTLQNALAEKAAWWAAMRPLLKIRLRCKAGHAEERAAFHSAPRPTTPLPQPPQNQLHCANCTCRKSGGLRCEKRGWRLKYKSCT